MKKTPSVTLTGVEFNTVERNVYSDRYNKMHMSMDFNYTDIVGNLKEFSDFPRGCYDMTIAFKNENPFYKTVHGLTDSDIPVSYPFKQEISKIQKIIQNGKATIIIDVYGNKTVVKYQDDEDANYYNEYLGLYMCLLRYFLDEKRYHDAVEFIFEPFMIDYDRVSATGYTLGSVVKSFRNALAEGMLIGLLGKKIFDLIVEDFEKYTLYKKEDMDA